MTSPEPASARVLVVGVALVDALGAPSRLLAARRTAPKHLAGRWELPGGKVEPGESPQQALHRELAEELGVGVRLGDEVAGPDDGCWPISDVLTMRVWLAELTDGEPVAAGSHDEVRWLAPGQWDDVPWLPADVPVVAALREVLRRPGR